jgi:hypothetical protein
MVSVLILFVNLGLNLVMLFYLYFFGLTAAFFD